MIPVQENNPQVKGLLFEIENLCPNIAKERKM